VISARALKMAAFSLRLDLTIKVIVIFFQKSMVTYHFSLLLELSNKFLCVK